MPETEVEVVVFNPKTRGNAGLFPPAVKTAKTKKVADRPFLEQSPSSFQLKWLVGVLDITLHHAMGQGTESRSGEVEV